MEDWRPRKSPLGPIFGLMAQVAAVVEAPKDVFTVADCEDGDSGAIVSHPLEMGEGDVHGLAHESLEGERVADHHHRPLLRGGRGPLKYGPGSRLDLLDRLAAGHAYRARVPVPGLEEVAEAVPHLPVGDAVQLAHVHLDEPLLHLDRDAVAGGDGVGGLRGPPEGTGEDGAHRLAGEPPGQHDGLGAAGLVQRVVAAALDPLVAVERGLAMTDENDLHGHGVTPGGCADL